MFPVGWTKDRKGLSLSYKINKLGYPLERQRDRKNSAGQKYI